MESSSSGTCRGRREAAPVCSLTSNPSTPLHSAAVRTYAPSTEKKQASCDGDGDPPNKIHPLPPGIAPPSRTSTANGQTDRRTSYLAHPAALTPLAPAAIATLAATDDPPIGTDIKMPASPPAKATRRTTRARTSTRTRTDHSTLREDAVTDEEGSEDEDSLSPDDGDDDSQDEWMPQSAKRRTGRRRRGEDDSEQDSDDGDAAAVDADRPAKKSRRGASGTSQKVQPPQQQRTATLRETQAADTNTTASPPAPLSAPPAASAPAPAAPKSLNAWLGLPTAPTPSIPWPTSPPTAQITDRESLFIAFVYPFTSSAPSVLSSHLTHLTSRVHPSLPATLFPRAFAHLDPRRRGATHDVHAWRVLELKRGRDGLGGPNDFGLEQGSDDDGERWAGERLLRVMQRLGAVDVLLVVSRWYGGVNLGPARFNHFEECAERALRAHMLEEELRPLRREIADLDREVAVLRGQSAASQMEEGAEPYKDLQDLEKAQRLVHARRKTIEVLQRRKRKEAEGESGTTSQSQPPPQPQAADQSISPHPEEEGAPPDGAPPPSTTPAEVRTGAGAEAAATVEPLPVRDMDRPQAAPAPEPEPERKSGPDPEHDPEPDPALLEGWDDLA